MYSTWLLLGIRNLTRKKIRTLLTMTGIVLAIGFTVGLLSLSEGFERSFQETMTAGGPQLLVTAKGKAKVPIFITRAATLDENIAIEIGKIKNVEVAEPVYQTMFFQGDVLALKFPSLIAGIPPDTFFKMRPQAKIVKGRALEKNDRYTAVLGTAIYDNLETSIGKKVTLLLENEFTVVGKLKKENKFFDYCAYIPLKTIQDAFQDKGKINQILVKLSDLTQMDETIKTIQKKYPHLEVQTMQDTVKEMKQMTSIARAVHIGVSTFAVGIGILFVASTMIMSISERIREFATVRVIGASGNFILKLVLSESIALSSLGGILGCILGFLLSKGLDGLILHLAGETFFRTYVSPRIFIWAMCISLFIGSIAGLFPTIMIMKKNLAESLKYE